MDRVKVVRGQKNKQKKKKKTNKKNTDCEGNKLKAGNTPAL